MSESNARQYSSDVVCHVYIYYSHDWNEPFILSHATPQHVSWLEKEQTATTNV